ncbi:hypothetical protein BpHYR1_010619 [Brachionus plicatilis]|uniref:Uncharacterized protein n=1 Tax=Brachionus plicatilis TaxID=10195 RepID=A0A3M7S799_BRAPC|nr:hypothetical protein BpHYR1_010619 [Brachionus plicatilis]
MNSFITSQNSYRQLFTVKRFLFDKSVTIIFQLINIYEATKYLCLDFSTYLYKTLVSLFAKPKD